MQGPRSWNGRALRLAFYGEILLALAAVGYFATRSGRLAAILFILSGGVGIASIQRAWRGRNEFGPRHAERTKWATRLFVLAAILLAYALIAVNTTLPDTRRIEDLRPPILAFGAGLLLETTSGALLLWELCGARRRPFAAAYAALGAVVAAGLVWLAMNAVTDLREAAGETVATSEQAQMRLASFLDDTLPWVMGGLLVTRLAALALLRIARREVAFAEADADTTGPSRSPEASPEDRAPGPAPPT